MGRPHAGGDDGNFGGHRDEDRESRRFDPYGDRPESRDEGRSAPAPGGSRLERGPQGGSAR
jgi:hypothetical protein